MKRFLVGIVFFLLSSMAPIRAESPKKVRDPHVLLPADCVAFFGYDGYVRHKKAYDQTALAKAMQEDLGEFLNHVFEQLVDQICKNAIAKDEDDKPAPVLPAKGPNLVNDPNPWPQVVSYLWQQGMLASMEIRHHPLSKEQPWRYLRDEDIPGQPKKVKIVRSNYLEFRLPATEKVGASVAEVVMPKYTSNKAAALAPAVKEVIASLEGGGGRVKVDNERAVGVNLDRAADLEPFLPMLRRLPDLEELSIRNKKLDDRGLAQLQGLSKLSVLNVNQSAIGNDGLKVLSTLPRLRAFHAASTRITDAGLAHLEDLITLDVLVLYDNKITDVGVAHLAKLKGLQGLFLNATLITDAGLEHLRGMSRVTKLNLSKTSVTDEGVTRLRKALPFYATIIREKKAP